MTSPMRILWLEASPVNELPLTTGEEARNIEDTIRRGSNRDGVELHYCLATRPKDFLRALQEIQPDVLHFSGHTTPDGQLVLLDEASQSLPVSAADVADLIIQFKDNLKLVFLNSCFTRL